MRALMILVLLATVLLSLLIFITADNSPESWSFALLLYATNGVFWIIIASSFYERYKKAKEVKNHALVVTLGVLVLATAAMSFHSFYALIPKASEKQIVTTIIPYSWWRNYFDIKPFFWALPAVVYNLVAAVMLYLFQSGLLEEVFEEREQRKQLEEITQRLEEKNRTLQTIDFISRALNQSLDLRTILEQLTQQVVRRFTVDLCTVRLNNLQNELVIESAHGEHAPELMKSHVQSDEGLAGWVFTQQRLLQVNKVQEDHRLSPNDPIVKFGVQSYIGLPLNLPMRGTLGCLEIYTFTRREFSAGDVEAYTLIANEAAIAIQNARNYQEAERRRKELEALNTFSSHIDSSISEEEIYRLFLKEISQHFSLAQVLILQKNSDTDFMEIVASLNPLTKKQMQLPILDEPAQCRAIRTGKDMVVQDLQKDVLCSCELLVPKQGSYLCQPLMMGGKTLGLVHLDSSQINYWDEDKHRMISAFAAAIAPAVGNLRLMAQEKNRAMTDQLTQVHNRRFLDEYLTKQFHIQKRQQNTVKTPMAILMLDLDHFKSFNDNFGHEVGDQVLQGFGTTLVATVRESDLVARYGGEEFCIVLAGTDLKGAMETAEKIRESTEDIDLSFMGNKAPKNITVSIGIAVYPDHGTNPQDLLKKADQALYEAKEMGRNRVCVADSSKQESLFSDAKPRKNAIQ